MSVVTLILISCNIDFPICRRLIAASLNDYGNCWCKREHAEHDALKECKINIFIIIDTRISFYASYTHLLPTSLNLLSIILNKVSRIFV